MTTPAHLIKTARRQMRKIRHRGAHTETERRLLASADQQREQGLGWRYDGFGALANAELFGLLARFGIAHDDESLRREAREAGSPTRLSERWEQRSTAEGKWRDLTTLAARELWRRLLPEERAAEVVADEIDELLEVAEVRADRETLWLHAARRLVAACGRDGAADRAFFERVQREVAADLIGWMVEMPSSLLSTPDAGDAPALCEAFARLVPDGKTMLAERAELLARLGRREEAVAQIEALLGEHPEDPVVLLKAGGTFEVLGELDRAQNYLRLYTEAMKDPHSSPTIAAAAKAGVDLPRPTEAVGPNDRCPCGSGKKYKRCHGLPS